MRTALHHDFDAETRLARRSRRLSPEAMLRIAENFRNLRRKSGESCRDQPGDLDRLDAAGENLAATPN